jgi:hypothetical protein
MAAGSQDRQPGCHRAADMEQREAVDHRIGFINSVNLSKAPGGVNLISVRQADELGAAGRPAGMKQRANGGAVAVELKLKDVTPGRERRIEADHLVWRIAVTTDYQNEAQRRHAFHHRGGLVPALRIVRRGRDHQHLGVFCDQQIGYRISGEQIVDRAGDTGDLGSEQGDLHLRQRGAEEGDRAAIGSRAERAKEIGRLRYPAEQFPRSEQRPLPGRRPS